MLLEIKNLHLTARDGGKEWEVVRGVSFGVREGEKIGIVGESGSGKTVLIRSLIGLLPSSMRISSGSVKYQGNTLSEMSEKELQKVRGKEIGMVFQDPLTFLNPTVRVGVQILEGYKQHFPRASKQEGKDKVLELLQKVGMQNPELCFHQFPHQLSGGQRQRVLIAIALIAEPRLLIADEPTTALDAATQTQIMHLLSQLQVGKTVILISHDLSLVASSCDRVLVMYAGQIVEDAPVEKLFSSPEHPYTEQLLHTIPSSSPEGRLISIPGAHPDLSHPMEGCSFAPRCPYAFEKCRSKAPPSDEKSRCWLRR